MLTVGFRIAREGIRWFVIFLALSCVALPFSVGAALTALVCGVLAALFFRIPTRVAPRGEGLVLSPADGKVVGVDDLEEPRFMQGPCRRVSIFLSIFDVHMNYAPVSGVIEWVHYQPGRFHWAFEPKASENNENQRIGIACGRGKILVRQIAGAVARRIVLFKQATQEIIQGERIGMIKFGSRVEIYLPRAFTIKVAVGDRVAGGLTVLAEAL